MPSDRVRIATALLGATLALGAASARWLKLDSPDYALAVPGNPVEIYTAGAAPTSAQLSRQFDLPVKNSGRKPIRIKSVRPLCRCTVIGGVSGDWIPPGGTLTIPLQVDLPPYGAKTTSLTLETSAETLPWVEVKLRLHGPDIETPMIVSNLNPVQFITEYAGELVLHQFTVVTMEKLDGEPWLVGMTSSFPDSNVERLIVVDVQQYPELNIVKRRYDFLLRFIGPGSENESLAFAVEPESTVPPVREARPLRVRCQLAPQAVAMTSP